MSKEVIEIENIFNINDYNPFDTLVNTKRIYDEGKSAKIITDNKKQIPLFTIGDASIEKYSPYRINGSLRNAMINKGFATMLLHPVKDECYSQAFWSIVYKAFHELISIKNFSNNRGYFDAMAAKLFIENTPLAKLNTLLLYEIYNQKKITEDWITSGIQINSAYDNIPNLCGSYYKYNSLIYHFFNSSGFNILKTRDPRYKYVVGKYYIAHYDVLTGNTTPLVCGVINKKHIPYFRAAVLLEDYISTPYMELWVHESFDVVRSEHKGLRPKYRKFIKNPLLKAGINIITKPSLMDLFAAYTPPKMKTLKDYEKFLIESSRESLENIREKYKIVKQVAAIEAA